MLATALVACGQGKDKAMTEKKATTQAQSKAPTQKKASTKAQKKQQDRLGDCNKQASLKNMKGEDRKRFMSSCMRG